MVMTDEIMKKFMIGIYLQVWHIHFLAIFLKNSAGVIMKGSVG